MPPQDGRLPVPKVQLLDRLGMKHGLACLDAQWGFDEPGEAERAWLRPEFVHPRRVEVIVDRLPDQAASDCSFDEHFGVVWSQHKKICRRMTGTPLRFNCRTGSARMSLWHA